MKIVEMFIDEADGESGIDAVSVVDNPAIELDFVALKEEKGIQLAEVDKEKKILMGAILTPDKPIYRKDDDGEEYHIFFSKDTVRKAMELFFKRGNQNNATEMHDKKIDGCTIVESWIKEDNEHDKSVKYGLSAPIGTWMGSMKIEDPELYEKAKKGELRGFSIEGFFADKLQAKKIESRTESIDKRLLSRMDKILEALNLKKKVSLEAIPMAENPEVIFEADVFEPGQPVVFYAASDPENKMPVPEGEYELEDGRTFDVVEEGMINTVGSKSDEAEPEQDQEMEEKKDPKKIIESTIKETQFDKETKEETVEVFFNDVAKQEIKDILLATLKELGLTEDEEKETEKVEAKKVEPIKHSLEKTPQKKVSRAELARMSTRERTRYLLNN